MILDLRARAPIYAWLSERLAREIDDASWRGMSKEPLRTLLGRFEPDLVQWLTSDLTTDTKAIQDEEYARLFLLPGGVSPLCSFWVATTEDREAARERITEHLERSFRAAGREPLKQEPWGNLPLEHLAVALDLVAVTAMSEDEIELAVAETLERDLLQPTLKGFGPALVSQSRSPLYRAVGALITSLGEATTAS